MSRLPRRPTRTHARRVAASIPLLIVALFALILLCPVNVKAQDDKSEYGTVIGIGEWWLSLQVSIAASDGCRQILEQRKHIVTVVWKRFITEQNLVVDSYSCVG